MTVIDRPQNGGAPLPSAFLAGEELPGRPCPIASTLAIVGEKWSLLALREVSLGNHRFTDIARNTGAPRDRLAARLKALVDGGILERHEYSTNPTRFGYHLTPAGKALTPVLRAMVTWGNTWALEQPAMSLRHHHPDGEHELEPVEICGTCGERVRARDVSVEVRARDWEMSGPTAR